ncbi:MAG: tetratricopeptide repeat protein [Treponema sp.]|nr:tetratricopeptide repeat protein [Treponema sp.]
MTSLIILFSATGYVSAQVNETDTAGPADTAESVLERIAERLSVSDYNEAIALFDAIPLPERDTSHLKLLKASVLSSAGKYAEARTITEAISAAEPRNTEALFVLAAIEGAAGRDRQQQTALEQIVRIEPNNSEALVALGNLSLQRRAMRPAASYFHQVLTKEPENPGALIGLSRAFRMNQEWKEAEVLLNRVVELYPGMVESRTERARFYWGREFLLQALADYDEAKRISPNDYWIAIDRGTLLLEMNRKSQALEEFNRAISINPREYRAYAYSAGLKDDLGDHDGAERDYAILARLKPDYYFALEGLGLHKMRKGNWGEARDAFMEAYRQAPEENLYALMVAINWMRVENITSPRTFLQQVQTRVKRDTLEWYMFRLYYDLTVRNYVGENDMLTRLDREKDLILKARMLFYMAMYYDVRGMTNLANRYFQQVSELDKRAIPEWRLNEWILISRNLKNF